MIVDDHAVDPVLRTTAHPASASFGLRGDGEIDRVMRPAGAKTASLEAVTEFAETIAGLARRSERSSPPSPPAPPE